MMVLMVLMVIDIANVHVIAHGASWMQREGLRVVVSEACHIRPIASKHVLLVRLLLLALWVLLIAFVARRIIFFAFVLGF